MSAQAEVVQRMGLRRGPWAVRVECRMWFSATGEAFEIRTQLDAFERDERVRSRHWDSIIPRDGV